MLTINNALIHQNQCIWMVCYIWILFYYWIRKNHYIPISMMTSSNGNIFCVTGHLCGEFTGPRWIPAHKGQWRGALMFSLICVWINEWVNNREAGDLRRYRAHYCVIVMPFRTVPNVAKTSQLVSCTNAYKSRLPNHVFLRSHHEVKYTFLIYHLSKIPSCALFESRQ